MEPNLDDEPIMRRKISFKPEFTLGGLFNIAAMVFIASGVYYTTRADIAMFKDEMGRMRMEVEQMHQESKETHAKMSEMEVKQERIETMIADDRSFKGRTFSPRSKEN